MRFSPFSKQCAPESPAHPGSDPLLRDCVTVRQALLELMVIRALLMVGAVVGLASCTDPTSIGPEPVFLGAGPDLDGRDTVRVPELSRDSCPTFARAENGVTRRNVPGTGATMAFPAGATVRTVSLDAARGAVFSVQDVGLIAVTYAPEFPQFFRNGRVGPRLAEPVGYNRWCRIAVGGRPAVLRVAHELVPSRTSGDSTRVLQFFLQDMAVAVTDPGGRGVNIRIVAASRNYNMVFGRQPLATLLAIVASLEW